MSYVVSSVVGLLSAGVAEPLCAMTGEICCLAVLASAFCGGSFFSRGAFCGVRLTHHVIRPPLAGRSYEEMIRPWLSRISGCIVKTNKP